AKARFSPAAPRAVRSLRCSASRANRERSSRPGRRTGRFTRIRSLSLAGSARSAARRTIAGASGYAFADGFDAGSIVEGDENGNGHAPPGTLRSRTALGAAPHRTIARDDARAE